jgi:Family of unknown function (DUF6481)
MKIKGETLDERRELAMEAKKAMLEKFRQKANPNDPELQAKLAERKVLAEARDLRHKEREAIKAAEAARIAAEKAEADRIAREAAEAKQAEELEVMLRLEAERKAARDARYAARKARRGKGNRK